MIRKRCLIAASVMHNRSAYFAALSFALAACLFPALGDLQGPGSSACAGCDAGVDVVSDVSLAPDGSDASKLDSSTLGFCASLGGTHKLCEDFDKGLFSAQFTNVNASMSAMIGSDTSAFRSPPNSLLVSLPSRPKPGDDAFMTRAFVGKSTSATYSFSFRVDSLTNGASGILAAFVLDDGQPNAHALAVYTTDTYAALEESFGVGDGGSTYIDHKFTKAIALGVWTRVSITLDLGTKTCSVTLDGATTLASSPIDPSWALGSWSINLGLTYVGSQMQPWQVRYDDVVYDSQ